MSLTKITVIIEDPAPPQKFGLDVAIYNIACEVDGEPRTCGLATSGHRTRAEADAEVCELVGDLILHRGELPESEMKVG